MLFGASESTKYNSDLFEKWLGDYRLLEMIGQGGQGSVYKAHDTLRDRIVAIKVFSASDDARREKLARFKYEAHLASSLNHPNICTVYDLFEQGQLTSMVLKYIEGKNLFELAFKQPLSVKSTVSIALQITGALSTAHKAGIVHRDIKPRNVVVSDDGHATLLDFGLAKLIDDPMDYDSADGFPMSRDSFFAEIEDDVFKTQEGSPLGTPSSSPPEMALGVPSDHRGDIFSMGVLIYLLLTGEYPFAGRTKVETRRKIIEDDPVPITVVRRSAEAVPVGLVAIVERALRKNPDERFQSMDEMHNALNGILDAKQMKIASNGITYAVIKQSGPKTPFLVIVVIVVLLIVALVIAVYNLTNG